VTTRPFPILDVFKKRAASSNAVQLAFMVGIALSLLPTMVVSFIVKERQDNLKFIQLISGMSKLGYWMSNAIADITKAYLTIGGIILLMFLFKVEEEHTYILLLLFPPAMVMFSYMVSFFSNNETNAQITVFALNFLISGIVAIMVFAMQTIPDTQKAGNQLRWWFCLVPTYCVTHGIILAASIGLLTVA
jgi:ATP-binding cassette, subfamily A (ABC1), member 3